MEHYGPPFGPPHHHGPHGPPLHHGPPGPPPHHFGPYGPPAHHHGPPGPHYPPPPYHHHPPPYLQEETPVAAEAEQQQTSPIPAEVTAEANLVVPPVVTAEVPAVSMSEAIAVEVPVQETDRQADIKVELVPQQVIGPQIIPTNGSDLVLDDPARFDIFGDSVTKKKVGWDTILLPTVMTSGIYRLKVKLLKASHHLYLGISSESAGMPPVNKGFDTAGYGMCYCTKWFALPK